MPLSGKRALDFDSVDELIHVAVVKICHVFTCVFYKLRHLGVSVLGDVIPAVSTPTLPGNSWAFVRNFWRWHLNFIINQERSFVYSRGNSRTFGALVGLVQHAPDVLQERV